MLTLLGLVPAANLLTSGQAVPWWRVAVLLWAVTGGLLVALLWIVASRWGGRAEASYERAVRLALALPRRRFVALSAAVTAALGAGVALYCYAGQPFTGDELAMGWHARMLLSGHLAIPAPLHPEFFNTAAVMDRGPRWYSQYPIGGPALIALGFLVHAPWLVNPLLLGVSSWQLHRFVSRAFGDRTARASVVLFALTPFVLVLGATQMSHTASLALTLWALAELAAWQQSGPSGAARHAALLGLGLGMMTLVRPLDALLAALPIGAFQLWRVRREWWRARTLLIQSAAGALPVFVLLWTNARTTGHPLFFAYDALNGAAHGIGFHLDPNGQVHTPLRGLVHASTYLLQLDRYLFEWPLPALLIVVLTLVAIRRPTRWDTLLIALAASFLGGYAAYWFRGFFDGPRFLFPVVPVFVIYAARASGALGRRARSAEAARVARWLVPACVVVAWLAPNAFSSVPARLGSLHDQRTKLKTDVSAQATSAGLTQALVFVRESWRGRLLARLRAIGIQQFEAERLVDTLDACALQRALDDVSADARRDTALVRRVVLETARRSGVAQPSPARVDADARVSFAAGAAFTQACSDEATSDSLGTMPYALFLREQVVDASGQLDGRVVWARDLGARNARLRQQYGDRRWYRYRPGARLGAPARFVPMAIP